MEKHSQSNDPKILTPESVANFEGNDGELLIARVNDPVIRDQMIEILYQDGMLKAERMRNMKLAPYVLPENTKLTCYKDEDGVIYTSNSPDYDPRKSKPKTRDELNKVLDEAVRRISTQTAIDFSTDEPNEECIPLNWKLPWSGRKPSIKQMSMIVAHEKGHMIRKYGNLEKYFAKGFDLSKVEYTDKDFEMDLAMREKRDEPGHLSRESLKADLIHYLFSGQEVAERMSQLKNYFGMRGSERFTIEHLRYAAQNYITDTGMDNRMTHFFQAITPETENAFIELINSSGI